MRNRKKPDVTQAGQLDSDLADEHARPGRVSGAMIATPTVSSECDSLGCLFVGAATGTTVGGADPAKAWKSLSTTSLTEKIALSDGTQIVFATTSRFDVEGAVPSTTTDDVDPELVHGPRGR
jgi:ferric-dicitrate binding protein FerR (iron transport regulator)